MRRKCEYYLLYFKSFKYYVFIAQISKNEEKINIIYMQMAIKKETLKIIANYYKQTQKNMEFLNKLN